MTRSGLAACIVAGALAFACPAAAAEDIVSAYTHFDADRNCRHTPGRDVEDYGTWRCPGLGGLIVWLSAGDQRMSISFGTGARQAQRAPAATSPFAAFNSVYRGTVEWRGVRAADGKMRPFATIMRWSVRTQQDAERDDGRSTGEVLVVTRLDPGGVCHVGFVDARGSAANARARTIADAHARSFRCGRDRPVDEAPEIAKNG
ncbi:MAG: hypothetical protein M5U33_09215 [Pseudorhodoplanes sp.]|nr:hypothetical protein [Pseudorhodoplanes sp.]